MTVRPSICCVPVMVRALGIAIAEGTQLERSQTVDALKNRRYTSATLSASARSPMMNWMTTCLLSHPTCIAGAATCSAMTTHTQVKLSAPELHHHCMIT